jgi:hypothetical protein
MTALCSSCFQNSPSTLPSSQRAQCTELHGQLTAEHSVSPRHFRACHGSTQTSGHSPWIRHTARSPGVFMRPGSRETLAHIRRFLTENECEKRTARVEASRLRRRLMAPEHGSRQFDWRFRAQDQPTCQPRPCPRVGQSACCGYNTSATNPILYAIGRTLQRRVMEARRFRGQWPSRIAYRAQQGVRLNLNSSRTGRVVAITSGWQRAPTAVFTLLGATRETAFFAPTPLGLMCHVGDETEKFD